MEMTVISTSSNKKEEAIEQFGADSFLISHDTKQMQAASGTMDSIIDTVSASHPLNYLVDLLRCNGKLILLDLPDLNKLAELSIFPFLVERKLIAGSAAGRVEGDTINDRFCWEAQYYCRC